MDPGALPLTQALQQRKHILDRNVPLNWCEGTDEQEIHRGVFLSLCSLFWDPRGHAAFLPLPAHQPSPLSGRQASNAAPSPMLLCQPLRLEPKHAHMRARGRIMLLKVREKHMRLESLTHHLSGLIRHVRALGWWMLAAWSWQTAVIQPKSRNVVVVVVVTEIVGSRTQTRTWWSGHGAEPGSYPLRWTNSTWLLAVSSI